MIDGGALGHVAGQYVDLIVPTSRGLAFRRSYSVASGPGATPADVFEIAVTRVAGGPTSEALHAARPGAIVEVEGPQGGFVRRPEDRFHPALFVATGTGLAPIRAILSAEVREPKGPQLVLLFGCRTPADILWSEELRGWARECPRLELHITLSRPPADWTGRHGYVQKHAPAIAETLRAPRVYVCGLSAMVDDVVAMLLGSTGLPREAIRYEPYD